MVSRMRRDWNDVVVHERDKYLAFHIRKHAVLCGTVLVVVGCAHVHGIQCLLEKEINIDIDDLLQEA